jgi:hypothetical protein
MTPRRHSYTPSFAGIRFSGLRFAGLTVRSLMLFALCAPGLLLPIEAQISVRSVKVVGSKGAVEVEVETSGRVTPQTQVLTGPDRLVVDFPNAVPGAQLRSQSVYRGEVKDVRVGLFQSSPPVTRLVLDLTSAQSYQVFPYSRTVMIKVAGGGEDPAEADDAPAPEARAGLVVANYTASAEPITGSAALKGPARSALDVSFRNGLLSIKANKATLSEVLFAVQQRTGAEIAIASGADQEKVVADIGPAPAADVLSRLLNGSKFNFMILSAEDNPAKLERVILTPRNESIVVTPQPQTARNNDADDDDEPPTAPPAPPVRSLPTNNAPGNASNNAAQPGATPSMPPDTKPADDNSSPQ